MSILKNILEKIIYENKFMEMAYNRKQLLDKISNQQDSFAEHLLNIVFICEYSDWDQTLKDILNIIGDLVNNKQHRKILTKELLLKKLYNEPIETNDFDYFYNAKCKSLMKIKKMKCKCKTNMLIIKNIIKDFIDIIYDDYSISREEIREIIEKYIKINKG